MLSCVFFGLKLLMKHSHSFLTYYWKTITEWRQVGYWLSFREKVFFATVGFGRRFVGNWAHCCISCHFVWDFYKGDLECDNSAVSLLFSYYPQIKAKSSRNSSRWGWLSQFLFLFLGGIRSISTKNSCILYCTRVIADRPSNWVLLSMERSIFHGKWTCEYSIHRWKVEYWNLQG